MAIKDCPEAEQPREKLLIHGPQALTDIELLAIFLRTGVKGKSVKQLAKELLERSGGLRGMLQADYESLGSVCGIGKAKYTQLKAILELARRYFYETFDRGQALSSPTETRDYLLLQLRDYQHEVFCVLFLDNKHRVIAFEQLFRGTVNEANVYPREVVRTALEHNASALIIAHNHPSGDPEPSHADHQLTRNLRAALDLVQVELLDHFIIGDGRCISFAERGWLLDY